jgi:isopentenyl-diphosphate Delta-isomerase
MVSSMTGGYPDALAINRDLAEVCEELGLAMGVGSQRQALEDSKHHRTFSIAREVAPSIPLVGNIGAAEVAGMKDPGPAQRLVDLIRASAFAVHLNPLQELLQPEGNTNFRGVLDGIALLVRELSVPVIVKEIGAGISAHVARRLLDIGVRYIDVAGAGGTSWAGVETLRSADRGAADRFWDWGIPTAVALRGVASMKSGGVQFKLIASGGINSGRDIAISLGLGADLAASARPLITALHRKGRRGLRALLLSWSEELRRIMFLTGSADIAALQRAPLMHTHRP